MKNVLCVWMAGLCALGLASCVGQVRAKKPVSYEFSHGQTALLRDGIAYAPRNAPAAVKRAIAAGNSLQHKPYKWGGGHARLIDSGYDCSGTVSYVLNHAGLMHGTMPSRGFYGYGKRGEGRWISVYVKRGHVFMTIAGLRLDTGGSGNRTGPRWKPQRRSVRGCVVRHPAGF